MKHYLARLFLGLLASGVLILHTAGVVPLEAISRLDKIVYDIKLKATMPGGVDDSVVIVDIDEKSLAHPELGRWPWSRDKVASLITTLFDQYGASVIGFDVVWAEPDNSSGMELLDRLSASELRSDAEFRRVSERLRAKLDFDQTFANALRNRPVVLGYYFNFGPNTPKNGKLPDPAMSFEDAGPVAVGLQAADGYGANIPKLQDSVLVGGHFNPTIDIDGVIRRVPLLIAHDQQIYESMSLSIVRLRQGIQAAGNQASGQLPDAIPGIGISPNAEQAIQNPSLQAVEVGSLSIPVDATGNMLVPFRGGRGSFPYISAADIFDHSVKRAALDGKIILIGTTAPGLQDFRSTSAGAFFPGVEVHANAIAGMLDPQRKLKSYPDYLYGFELISLSLIGFLLSFLLPKISAIKSTVMAFAAASLTIGINWWAWQSGLSLPITALILTILSIYFVNMSYGYFIESKAKRDFTALFGQYVPAKLVEEMSRDPSKYSMEGQKKELTILFTDIVGFTPVSEKLKPVELSRYVNRYLTELSQIISDHEGTIDKYIGDAIMAFWGAPVDNPRHRERAVLAAIKMQERVFEISQEYAADGWPPLKVAIGVATGEVVVGDMGSTIRRAYTVIGDTVNLAARLEAATRQYGVSTLIADSTADGVDNIQFREIDSVRVKGKIIPVKIFEPIRIKTGDAPSPNTEMQKWTALLASYRSQQWVECERLLMELENENPEEMRYKKFRERIEKYREVSNWDGITTLESK